MDQTKWQKLIRDELVNKLEAGEELTFAERAMAALVLANARFADRPPEPDVEVTDTSAHIALELQRKLMLLGALARKIENWRAALIGREVQSTVPLDIARDMEQTAEIIYAVVEKGQVQGG